ncbi:MAG: penicillin-binding transpeptidase domain-containing protein, partial [Cyclobacteriaceae bacterium]
MWSKVLRVSLIVVFFGTLLAAGFFILAIILLGDRTEPSPDVLRSDSREAPVIVRNDWNRYLDSCQVQGSITIYNLKADEWYTSDTADMNVQTLPASTFKILNTLILLEEDAAASEKDSIYWPVDYDTARYGHRPDIYHSMPLQEAFRKSAGWAYIELAKKVSKDTYLDYFDRIGYGNGDLSVSGTDFWNFGPFGVSPREQISTVKGIYQRAFPFSHAHYLILSDMMVAERGDEY